MEKRQEEARASVPSPNEEARASSLGVPSSSPAPNAVGSTKGQGLSGTSKATSKDDQCYKNVVDGKQANKILNKPFDAALWSKWFRIYAAAHDKEALRAMR